MKGLIVASVLVLAFSTLTCESGQAYVKIVKTNGYSANAESYVIKNGNVIVAQSPIFVDNEERVSEFCLASSTNSQYTFQAIDSYGDGWDRNSHFTIYSKFNTIVLRNFLESLTTDTYPLSLYTPIEESSDWKVTSGTPGAQWNTVSFVDSAWTTVNLASPTITTSGTQYFRKSFTGIVNLAAYELRLKYKYGIVAHINGNEVYRDNMPEGVINPDTEATGSYAIVAYRGVVRGADEVSTSVSVVAIEIHFTEVIQTTVDFNAWMMIYASSNCLSTAPSCYQLPTPDSFISTIEESEKSFDLLTNTMMATMEMSDAYMIGSYADRQVKVNGYSVWIPIPQGTGGSSIGGVPIAYSVGGIAAITASTSSPVTTVISQSRFTPNARSRMFSYSQFTNKSYRHYRVSYLESFMPSRFQIREQGLYVCNIPIPTVITYSPSSYVMVIGVTTVNIAPTLPGFIGCTVSPALPAGLTLGLSSCVITGIATVLYPSTIHTVTSSVEGFTSVVGTLTLSVDICPGGVVRISRKYPSRNAAMEWFRITQVDDDSVVFEEAPNTSQSVGEVIRLFCSPKKVLRVTYGSEVGNWGSGSLLNLFVQSGTKEEQVAKLYYSPMHNLQDSITFIPYSSITENESWNYKMGSVPTNWYDDSVTGWLQGTKGTFPEATSRIQMYKKTFNIDALAGISGLSIGLRYKFAVIVYLNGILAFQNGFNGAFTDSSTTEHVFEALDYYSVVLPRSSVQSNANAGVSLLKTGSNTIAIGLLSIGDTSIASTFDATLLLLHGDHVVYHFQLEGTSGGSFPVGAGCLNPGLYSFISSSCSPNFIEIQYDNKRRVALTSFVPVSSLSTVERSSKGVIVKAKREATDEAYVTIGEFSGWKWWGIAQHKRIFLSDPAPYNIYRFENMSSDEEDCSVNLPLFYFSVDNLDRDIPNLIYNSQDAYLNVELAEIFPNSDLFKDFSISPALPIGLGIDQATGAIVGTAKAISSSVTYTISAKKINGLGVSTTFDMAVIECKGQKSLITSTISTSSTPSYDSYKLYNGRDASGSVIRQEATLYMSNNNVVFADFCLPPGLYTLEQALSYDGGISFPGGHSLSVDSGSLRFDATLYHENMNRYIRTVFSSYLPFQINFDDWRIYKSVEALPDTWMRQTYDDSTWTLDKASKLGLVSPITAYLRRSFDIPSLTDYHVLNIHMKYSGGVAVYFNSRLVARYNLPESFNSATEASTVHDSSVYSKFHIILVTSGAVAMNNVIAFEEHRAIGQTSADPMVFDATGVFGVNDCSIVTESFSLITGTPLASGVFGSLFDMNHSTQSAIENSVGTSIELTVENQEGMKFNSYGYLSNRQMTLGWSLYGRHYSADDFTTIHEIAAGEVKDRERSAYSSPVGIASFKFFKWEIDIVGPAGLRLAEFFFQYCKATGNICPGVGDYPPVSQGQISPGPCPAKHTGYSFRTCVNDQLSEVDNSMCIPKLPANLKYEKIRYEFVMNLEVTTGVIIHDNIVDKFYLDGTTLPTGLLLNPLTGEINGSATEAKVMGTYRVYGENARGASFVDVEILTRLGRCPPDSIFQSIEVNETFVYECSNDGAYIGTQTRVCKLGATDGVWDPAAGFCLHIAMIVGIILVVIIIIVLIVFILIRVSKRKSIGGVKGKKATTVVSKVKKEKTVKV